MAERFLVTGAQGFLGRWVCATLLDGAPEIVVGVGRSPRSSTRYTTTVSAGDRLIQAPLPAELLAVDGDPAYAYRQLDVGRRDAVARLVEEVRPDVVVHAAAALRDESWADLVASNIVGTTALVEALPSGCRLVLVSSGSVYGAADQLPLREDAACLPVDPYAVTKLAAENAARVVATRGGVELWTVRAFNLIGPGLQERHLPAALAAQLSAIAAGVSPPTLRLGNLDSTRDFVDVRDAAAAVALLARSSAPAPGMAGVRAAAGVVNVASGRETPVQTVFDLLLAAAASGSPLPDLTIDRLPPRPADTPRAFADVTRLTELGFAPRHPLAASLADMIAYYRDLVLPRIG